MKTYTFSKKDLAYIQPLDAVMTGINTAIQVYVVNQMFKRFGVPTNTRARYDLEKGELYVEEPKEVTPVTVDGKAENVPGVPEEPTTEAPKEEAVEPKAEEPKTN